MKEEDNLEKGSDARYRGASSMSRGKAAGPGPGDDALMHPKIKEEEVLNADHRNIDTANAKVGSGPVDAGGMPDTGIHPTVSSDDGESSAPQPAAAEPTTVARGRGRGRVKPKAAPRKKPPTRIVTTSSGASSTSHGRGRGKPGQGRGEPGRDKTAFDAKDKYTHRDTGTQHSASVIGLGQIAPRKAALTTGSQASTPVSAASRKSSAMASQSSFGDAASRPSGVSFASAATGPGAQPSSTPGGYSEYDSGDPSRSTGAFRERGGTGMTSRPVNDSMLENSDTDDELNEEDFAHKNQDVASFAGKVSQGMLLPVSLPSLRVLAPPPKAETLVDVDEAKPSVEKDDNLLAQKVEARATKSEPVPSILLPAKLMNLRPATSVKSLAKEEPMEIVPAEPLPLKSAKLLFPPDVGNALDPLLFPAQTPARHFLAATAAPVFVQLPGLLPLRESSAVQDAKEVVNPLSQTYRQSTAGHGPSASSSPQIRSLGTDIRHVGRPGEIQRVARMRIYKSGRVELIFPDGSPYDITVGAHYRTNQQLVALNIGTDHVEKTCDEIANSLISRLVCTPGENLLVSTGKTSVKSAPTV